MLQEKRTQMYLNFMSHFERVDLKKKMVRSSEPTLKPTPCNCLRCGRKLTDVRSINSGMGKKCTQLNAQEVA